MADAPAEAPASEPSAPRRRLPLILVSVATLLAFLAIFALWANRQLLDTDNWTDTSSELLENDEIRGQTATFLVDQLYANVDVQGQIAEALPPRAQPLAGPAAGGLRDLAVRGADSLLQRPRPQALWEQANQRAHARLLNIVEGGGDVVSTEGGAVTLDLRELVGQTADRVGAEEAESRIPEGAGQITIMESDNLELAQDAVRYLKASAIVLLVLAIGLMVLAVYLASAWRREALRAVGFGFLLAGVAALVARSFAGDAVVDALASTEAVRPAAEAVWTISTDLLVEAASASIAYGIVLIFSAWLAGPTAAATSVRRTSAPYLREPRIAYGAFAAVALLLLAWGPTPALRQPVGALILIALLALGLEVLRRQTAREFPDASREASVARIRSGVAGMSRWVRAGRAPAGNGHGNGAVATDRLEQLERLARLREAGVLDAPEFEREKAEILGSPAPPAPAGGQG